jgi:hypothetical protein
MKATIVIAILFVEGLFFHAPISCWSFASMIRKISAIGSSTVASTLALSAIESSGAPGMRMIAAAISAAVMSEA